MLQGHHIHLSVSYNTHITLLAKAEVSRHLPSLRRIAAIEFPGIDFQSLIFVVDFTTNPPTLRLETPDSMKREEYEYVVEDLLQRVGSYDPNRVALLRIEPLMDVCPEYVDSVYRLVELDKTGFSDVQLTAILESGKVAGGKARELCLTVPGRPALIAAEYDIIDEIVRRADGRLNDQPKLCNTEYATIIEEEVASLQAELGSSAQNLIYL